MAVAGESTERLGFARRTAWLAASAGGRATALGDGLGDAACNVIFQMVLAFKPCFYTDVYGLAPAAMGTMFFAVRILNSLADPVMGAIADRTEIR